LEITIEFKQNYYSVTWAVHLHGKTLSPRSATHAKVYSLRFVLSCVHVRACVYACKTA